jgi:hypothetical protein
MRHDRDGPLLYPGAAVSSRPAGHHRSAPAASQRPALHPRCHHPSAREVVTRHQQRFTQLTRPIFPLPIAPERNENPFGVSLQLRTPPLPATHAKAGTGLTDTDPELHPRHQSNLPTASPLTTCDLASHYTVYPGNGDVHTTVAWSSAAACRLSTARSLKPWCSYPPQGLTMTRHHQGFTIIHPAQPSPHL